MSNNTAACCSTTSGDSLRLDGLPAFLRGGNLPILNLFGYTSRSLRETFIRKFKNSDWWKKNRRTFPEAPDDTLLEVVYSSQRWRFLCFWHAIQLAQSKNRKPIDIERNLKKAPDILVFLLHAYDPECFDAEFDASSLVGLDTDLIGGHANVFLESLHKSHSLPKTADLRYLMLWPKLMGDLEGFEQKPEEDRRRVTGAVFALASAYNSPELIELSVEHAISLRAEFTALLGDSPPETEISPAKTWQELVEDLQCVAAQLAENTSYTLLDTIDSLVIKLREAAAEHLNYEADAQWVEQFFSRLESRCAADPALDWLAGELTVRRQPTLLQHAGQLRQQFESSTASLERDLNAYCTTTAEIVEKKATLVSLETGIQAAPLSERQQLRGEEKACRDAINALSDRLSELESSLVAALDFQLPTPPQPYYPEASKALAADMAQQVNPQRFEPAQEAPSTSFTNAPPALEETCSIEPDSDREPEPLAALVYEVPLVASLAPAVLTCVAVPEDLDEPPSISTYEVPLGTEPESQNLSSKPKVGETRSSLPAPQPFSMPPRTESDLLSALVDEPQVLDEADWIALGRLQKSWLERRQALRAWVLADQVERRLALLEKHVEGLALLPSWTCRLLLLVTDAKLPLSDDEIATATDDMYKIRMLDNGHKELVVLWLCAALLSEMVDKPLRITRLVSPQQFDLPPHSLAASCAKHLLEPVFNGGSLRPPKNQNEARHEYIQAIDEAEALIDPRRNNYQKSWIRSFWRDLIAAEGPMGRILRDANAGRFPERTLSADVIVENMPDWCNVQSSYRHNMQSRMEQFADLIERARAAYKAANEAPRECSTLSKQGVQDILDGIQPQQPCSAWWLEAIKSGIAELIKTR